MTRLASLLGMIFAALLPMAAHAQGTQVRVGTGLADPDAPVEITADELAVDRSTGHAVFTGNVLVIQSGLRMSADRIEVAYIENPTADQSPIHEVIATGNVILVNGSEAAEGDRAVFTPDEDRVVVTGNVLLTQGQTSLSGGRLVVDLATGAGRMEGRVKTVFTPGGD